MTTTREGNNTRAGEELVPFGWVLNIIDNNPMYISENHIGAKLRSAEWFAVCREHGVVHLLITLSVFVVCDSLRLIISYDDVDSGCWFGGNGSYCSL